MNDNQVGVILEEVRDMFKTLAEGQSINDKRQSKIECDIEHLKEDMKQVKAFLVRIDDGLNENEQRITELERKTS